MTAKDFFPSGGIIRVEGIPKPYYFVPRNPWIELDYGLGIRWRSP